MSLKNDFNPSNDWPKSSYCLIEFLNHLDIMLNFFLDGTAHLLAKITIIRTTKNLQDRKKILNYISPNNKRISKENNFERRALVQIASKHRK